MMAAVMAATLLGAAILLPVLLPSASLLSLMLIIGSQAVVAFVILRRGEAAALRSAGICLVLLVVLSVLLAGSAVLLPSIALVFWLPAMIAAVVLRRSVRLDLAVLVVTGLGALVAVGVMVVVGDGADVWREMLVAQLGDAERMGITPEQFDVLIDSFASKMTGFVGASVMLVALSALFVARYWQASLVKPGGFQEEFHALSLGAGPGIACVVAIAMSVVLDGVFWDSLAIVLVAAFFIQGLAVVHAIVKQRGLARGWLVFLYAMLPLPHTTLLLAALGLADNIFHMRRPGTPSA